MSIPPVVVIPAEFPPLPEPPAGHHWVPRGWGYESDTCQKFCVFAASSPWWSSISGINAGGMRKFFYVEAVPNADQREEVAKLQAENRELREALFNLASYCESTCNGEPGWPRDALGKADNLLKKLGVEG